LALALDQNFSACLRHSAGGAVIVNPSDVIGDGVRVRARG
jgi:hypothetical protein